MLIIKVVRRSAKNSRVRFDNGVEAKIPSDYAIEGSDIPDSKIIQIESPNSYVKDYIHEDLLPESVIKRLQISVLLPWEVNLIYKSIRKSVWKHIRQIRRNPDPDYIEDVVEEVFLHLYERDYFSKYDKTKTGFQSYISVAVKRLFIDWLRSGAWRQGNHCFSLNSPMSSESEGEFQDLIPAKDLAVEELVFQNLVVERILEKAEHFGRERGCIAPGFSYLEVFKHYLKHGTIDDIQVSSDFENMLRRNFRKLLGYLEVEFKELTS